MPDVRKARCHAAHSELHAIFVQPLRNTDRVVKLIIKGQHCKQRTLKAQITLKVPEAKMKSFAEKNRYGSWETGQAIHRPLLMQISDVEMASLYSAEMRGFAQYYALADNFSSLSRLRVSKSAKLL
jgi:hypothetical protein